VTGTASKRIEETLRAAPRPMTIDEICVAVFGRTGNHRDRSLVRQNLHRLDARGLLIGYPRTYALTPTTEATP
jgi:hypothetical protein